MLLLGRVRGPKRGCRNGQNNSAELNKTGVQAVSKPVEQFLAFFTQVK